MQVYLVQLLCTICTELFLAQLFLHDLNFLYRFICAQLNSVHRFILLTGFKNNIKTIPKTAPLLALKKFCLSYKSEKIENKIYIWSVVLQLSAPLSGKGFKFEN